jgi:hypothetical protein
MKRRGGGLSRFGRRKAGYQQSVRINISLPPTLDARKGEVCAKFSFSTFSDWVQAHLRKDLGIEIPQ